MINSRMQTIILKMTSWILLSNRLLTISFQSKWYLLQQKLRGWKAGGEGGRLGEYGHALPFL